MVRFLIAGIVGVLLLIVITVSLRSVTDPIHRVYADKYCYFIYNDNPIDVWAHVEMEVAPALLEYYSQERLKPRPDSVTVPKEGRIHIPANSPVRLVDYHQDSTIAEIQLLPVREGVPHVYVPANAVHDIVSSRRP